jgi:phosphate transport system permease protein
VLPLHYEGYPEKGFVYQSSAGTQDAELKMSLVPLVFGTLKATFYAMLFAVPIAIAAAIYSSEFMDPSVRSVVKPTIELMASLPSVVLGFIGALVLAPLVESIITSVLLTFVAVPLGVVLFGFLWQLLPPRISYSIPAAARFGLMFLMVVFAGLLCYLFGPNIEKLVLMTSGERGLNTRDWLSGKGGATPGWLIFLTPLIAIGLSFAFNNYIKPRLPLYFQGISRVRLGSFEMLRFLALALVAFAIALTAGWLLSSAGVDLRGNLLGGYVQRNSLMLGLMMGFAIIPIIYTVSEDALTSVPMSLRSASLGAGATPWQTAIRVVLPVAASGVFSATMIGFGRAAGETMIVLMMSGRTPIIDMNIFNGLSALSANIATEMPEATVNSTHYRMLFMSTMVLFVLTFIVNTAAEVIRARFRKRAYQL